MQRLRIALIDEEAISRDTLRSHLLFFHQLEICSFSSPQSFKQACFRQDFDIVLCNQELRGGRTGTQWCEELTINKLIKPSTGLVIITGDSSAAVISQIIDANPDIIFLKPYTLNILKRHFDEYFAFRNIISPHLNDLDNDRVAPVIHALLAIAQAHPQHLQSTYRLLGKLYLQSQQYLAAYQIYESSIASFPNALWAKWGMIKSQFLNGDWDNCANLLNTLIQTKATRDKALEWLACVAFAQQDYSAASEYLARILTSDLSLQATKLKSHLYCLQSQVDQAISLLTDKCNANHMLKDQFKELTFDLVHCVIQKIQHEQDDAAKSQQISHAKRLLTRATRKDIDLVSLQKRDSILTSVCMLEGDSEKIQRILKRDWMQNFERASVATIQHAINANQSIGEHSAVARLLTLSKNKLHKIESHVESVLCTTQFESQEALVGDQPTRAARYNETGSQLYGNNKFEQSMYYYYKAHQLYPKSHAFALNLLTCMHHCRQIQYKEALAQNLLNMLSDSALKAHQKKRLQALQSAFVGLLKRTPPLRRYRIDVAVP
jgi:tetratricopeptide (TPR) repeat protein